VINDLEGKGLLYLSRNTHDRTSWSVARRGGGREGGGVLLFRSIDAEGVHYAGRGKKRGGKFFICFRF